MEVVGIPSGEVLGQSQRKTKFFNESNMPLVVQNSHGKVRKPGTKVLDDVLEVEDASFVDFIEVSPFDLLFFATAMPGVGPEAKNVP